MRVRIVQMASSKARLSLKTQLPPKANVLLDTHKPELCSAGSVWQGALQGVLSKRQVLHAPRQRGHRACEPVASDGQLDHVGGQLAGQLALQHVVVGLVLGVTWGLVVLTCVVVRLHVRKGATGMRRTSITVRHSCACL